MGNRSSASRLTATICVPLCSRRIEELRLSYCEISCCGKTQKTIATFTFAEVGWHTPPSGVFLNSSTKVASVQLDKLSHMDPFTLVTVSGLAGGKMVFQVNVLLSDLLNALSDDPQAGWASTIAFDLRPGDLFDRKEVRDNLVLAAPSWMSSPTCTPSYVMYCNGRYCGETHEARGGVKGWKMLQEEKRTLAERKIFGKSHEETTTVVFPRSTSVSASKTYHVRLIVHKIEEISQFGELFPDIYVKARMKTPLGDWRRTDVHLKVTHSEALFEYRLVLVPFKYPPRPVKAGFCRDVITLPPTLEIRMMDQDRSSSDDVLGGLILNLEELPLPEDDGHGCGLATLDNELINLFDEAAVQRVRHRAAVFPREVTGYWPLLKKKKMNREVKAVGNIRLTIQLLTAKEAATWPAAQGNKAWALNRYPTLPKPKREHGTIRDKIILEMFQYVESAVALATGIPSLREFIVVVIIVTYLFVKVKTQHVEALAEAVHHFGRLCISEYHKEMLFLLCFCLLSCVTWTFMKSSFLTSKGPGLDSTLA